MATKKTVTLYVDAEVIDRLNMFADATFRSKSHAAEIAILHGIANYDIASATPQKVATPKKATKANTKSKKPALPANGKVAAAAKRAQKVKASEPQPKKPAKPRGRPRKAKTTQTAEAAQAA